MSAPLEKLSVTLLDPTKRKIPQPSAPCFQNGCKHIDISHGIYGSNTSGMTYGCHIDFGDKPTIHDICRVSSHSKCDENSDPTKIEYARIYYGRLWHTAVKTACDYIRDGKTIGASDIELSDARVISKEEAETNGSEIDATSVDKHRERLLDEANCMPTREFISGIFEHMGVMAIKRGFIKNDEQLEEQLNNGGYHVLATSTGQFKPINVEKSVLYFPENIPKNCPYHAEFEDVLSKLEKPEQA